VNVFIDLAWSQIVEEDSTKTFKFEEYCCFLLCIAVLSYGSTRTFGMNVPLPTSGHKYRLRRKYRNWRQAGRAYCSFLKKEAVLLYDTLVSFVELHAITTQRTILFKVTAVRDSLPAKFGFRSDKFIVILSRSGKLHFGGVERVALLAAVF
jgi:hypothetical protein